VNVYSPRGLVARFFVHYVLQRFALAKPLELLDEKSIEVSSQSGV